MEPIHIIGGGLAGCEAAWQAARAGASVVLHEMRPVATTAAHHTDLLAELVCSNSFRSDDAEHNAVGLLHAEMRAAGSLILACGDAHPVPAGGAMAVDREGFAAEVTARIAGNPRIAVAREEVAAPAASWRDIVIATGPLTSPGLSGWIQRLTGADSLAFFDAIAPIVHLDSIDMAVAWKQSRYDKTGPSGEADAYINCPMDKAQYNAFIDAVLAAPKAEFKGWEHVPYFDGCLPLEVMAERGRETPRHGPMKPVGLTNPHRPDDRPHAVVQLRQDNALGLLWNMVGFQTKLKHGAQSEVFRMIPGLQRAVFARLGGLHRNTFIDSPRLLDAELRLKADPRIRFAGQITGVEGYVESAAIGLLAGRFAAARVLGGMVAAPPPTTALGALLGHITGGHLNAGPRSFQPMNINYGLLPEITPPEPIGPREQPRRRGEEGRAKKAAIGRRALADLGAWLTQSGGGES
ncbi:MAG: methylenetetrahydrofolate--tRNA-(uracil(54)-C(5))-methyltransferase (FADH(2)-oxidizing) TrmFO [Caulobacteraceae bacterium]